MIHLLLHQVILEDFTIKLYVTIIFNINLR